MGFGVRLRLPYAQQAWTVGPGVRLGQACTSENHRLRPRQWTVQCCHGLRWFLELQAPTVCRSATRNAVKLSEVSSSHVRILKIWLNSADAHLRHGRARVECSSPLDISPQNAAHIDHVNSHVVRMRVQLDIAFEFQLEACTPPRIRRRPRPSSGSHLGLRIPYEHGGFEA